MPAKKKCKDVYDAAEQLPRECRRPFLECWAYLSLSDLYDGELEKYMDVICQKLRDNKDHITRLEAKIETIANIVMDE